MDDIAIVCVLYNPSAECIDKWNRLSAVIPNCIFVDNSGHVEHLLGLSNYIGLGKNYGIAKAQNIGISKAKELNCKYVVFFDQDSNVSYDIVKSLFQEYISLKRNGIKIGAIGPALYEINTGKLYKGSESNTIGPKEVNCLISSGCLTEISVIEDVGGLNNQLFIDLVDHEWCWRTKSKGYRLFMSTKALMPHQVGKESIHILGFPILISSPFRYYYQYRNTIWLIKLQYAPKEWKRKVMIRKIIELFIVPFKTGNFILTYKSIFKGIKDGIIGKL